MIIIIDNDNSSYDNDTNNNNDSNNNDDYNNSNNNKYNDYINFPIFVAIRLVLFPSTPSIYCIFPYESVAISCECYVMLEMFVGMVNVVNHVILSFTHDHFLCLYSSFSWTMLSNISPSSHFCLFASSKTHH